MTLLDAVLFFLLYVAAYGAGFLFGWTERDIRARMDEAHRKVGNP